MRKAFFTTAVALGVSIASYAMMPPSALATTPNTCAMLAGSFSANFPRQITAADQLHQMIEGKIYAACLKSRAKQGASRKTAPGPAGTNTTNAGAFVTFDVPGSVATNHPTAINNPGAITGYYDAGSFLRTSHGTITPFNPPGATNSGATGITPDGTIVGSFSTASAVHGYLRAPNGTFTVFDPPGSGFTLAEAINPAGTVTGGFSVSIGAMHGFLRAPNGTFTTFDPPGSTSTDPAAINPAGTVTGTFTDVTSVVHGFLRTSDGTITRFDPSELDDPEAFTQVTGINPAGTIIGLAVTDFEHGFLRAPNGTFTYFDPPGSFFTIPTGINPAGTIVGYFFFNQDLLIHGFLRAPNGTFTVFDPPGSFSTLAEAVNPAGTVTGNFTDFSGDHGFVGRPKTMH
jgi:uncharacterized membrane protein